MDRKKYFSKDMAAYGVALTAGLVYNSWIFGPIFNPAVGLQGLASELEARHQPFNWLFVTCDIVSSLAVIGLCAWLWSQHRAIPKPRLRVFVLSCYALFGFGTIIDALLPIRCDEVLQRCPSYRQDHLLLVHGLFSISASLALFAGLSILWWQRRRSSVLLSIMVGYILFGVFSFISAIRPGRDSWAQHYYIGLCGISIALLPYLMGRSLADVASLKSNERQAE